MNPVSHNTRQPVFNWTYWIITIVALGCTAKSMAGQNGPSLNLFPTTVLEDIRHTGEVAKEMEAGLQSLIGKLDQQQQLYVNSQCEGAEEDKGCQQLEQQLNGTYMQMLDVMAENLPQMEQAVVATRANLERRLRSEIGHKMTPWELQQSLLGQAPNAIAKSEPQLRGHSGMKLSDRFGKYYKLVANSSRKVDESLMVIASDIYLDMEATEALIARTQDEIARASLMGKLNSAFGAITPEMQNVVEGVKGILFGDPEANHARTKPTSLAENEGYISPLEL